MKNGLNEDRMELRIDGIRNEWNKENMESKEKSSRIKPRNF